MFEKMICLLCFLIENHEIWAPFLDILGQTNEVEKLRSRAADFATLLRAAAAGAKAVIHHRAGGLAACPGPEIAGKPGIIWRYHKNGWFIRENPE